MRPGWRNRVDGATDRSARIPRVSLRSRATRLVTAGNERYSSPQEHRAMLIFRQLFDPQSSTYSYLLGDARTREAVLIDPVFEQVRRDAALVCELDLKLFATLDTHVHADHVTGAWLLKRQFH